MKLIVVGGQSRSVGKTSLVASIIQSTQELSWTAFKITQYGHGVCSTSGGTCACTIEDPACPYAITQELCRNGRSDTSRFLRAGAHEVYWVRTRMGQLSTVVPELKRMLSSREFVIMESNSILEFLRPDLYISVLQPAISDFKVSSRLYFQKADAYVVSGSGHGPIGHSPVFAVQPPEYCSQAVLELVCDRLKITPVSCD